jgi:hypothetical protein
LTARGGGPFLVEPVDAQGLAALAKGTRNAMIGSSGSVVSVAVLAGVLAATGGCSRAQGEDPSLLIGRVWMESRPEKPTDYVHGLYLLARPSLGVFQRSSSYDFHFERVDYKRDGGALRLKFPQSGKEAEVTFAVTACKAPAPFDLCLDLAENPWGGPKRYYGKRAQDDEDEAAARAARATLERP